MPGAENLRNPSLSCPLAKKFKLYCEDPEARWANVASGHGAQGDPMCRDQRGNSFIVFAFPPFRGLQVQATGGVWGGGSWGGR